MKTRTLVLGFKRLPHAEKMAAKTAHHAQLAAMPYADRETSQRIEYRGYTAHLENRRNGVGRPPLYKRFRVQEAA